MSFNNNLIIGLGGTGGAAVKAFREITVERREEHAYLITRNRRFAYLYVDSNQVDIAGATRWSHLDEDIRLVEGTNAISVALPAGTNAQTICRLPNVRPWISSIIGTLGDTSFIGQLQTGTIQGAGQRRRYGRLLESRDPSLIRNAIQSQITALTDGLVGEKRKVTFHIFATLGGGTGSGSIVDVLTLIPSLCRQFNIDWKIIPYLFVGGAQVGVAHTGYFFQNEFCALRDINALMANRYRPYRSLIQDITQPFHDTADPIDAVYISTEENGVRLDSQVKRMAASCYDLISFVPDASSDAGRAFSGEDVYGNNPGEISRVVEDPLTREIVVKQVAPENDGRQLVDIVDRSYRFQTLSGARARHPMHELHGILSAELGKKVIDRWLNGDFMNRGNRKRRAKDNLDIFPIGEAEDSITIIRQKQDEAYRKQKLQEYDSFIAQMEEEGEHRKSSSLNKILKKTKEIRDAIMGESANQVEPNMNGVPTDVELTSSQQADADRERIIARLEGRRVWQTAGHNFGTTWGINDMIVYLEDLIQELKNQGIDGMPAIDAEPDKNMRRRSAEWNKLGVLSFKTTQKPNRMFDYQVDEGRDLIKEACDTRIEAIRRVRNRMLIALLEEDADKYREGAVELKNQQTAMEQKQVQCRSRLGNLGQHVASPELHEGDDRVLVWNEEYLDRHLNHYSDDAMSGDDVNTAMISCEVRFRAIVGKALNLVTRASTLFKDLIKEGQELWRECDRIHERLCNIAGTRRFERAYAATIYHYLAGKDAAFRTALTTLLMTKIAPSARVVTNGDPTCGRITPGPWRGSCLGMSDAAELTGDAAAAHADMKTQLTVQLTGRSSVGRMETYEHSDAFEIRLCHTMYFMPLRYFTVYNHLNTEYLNSIQDKDMAALYYANIDTQGMLDPSPDRPDVLPETDPDRHEAREKARATNAERRMQDGGLRDNGRWQKKDKNGAPAPCEETQVSETHMKKA